MKQSCVHHCCYALRLRLIASVLLGLLASISVHAQTSRSLPTDLTVGQSVSDVLDLVRENGFPLIYSSSLVSDKLKIQAVPTTTEVVKGLSEVLAPFGLDVFAIDDVYVVGRSSASKSGATPTEVRIIARDATSGRLIDAIDVDGFPANVTVDVVNRTFRVLPGSYALEITAPGYLIQQSAVKVEPGTVQSVSVQLVPESARLEEIVVSASRYDVTRDAANSMTSIDRQEITRFPDLGDDPLRTIQRLPGIASTGASAQSYVRGASPEENGVILDGHLLLDPFHVRDYQSLFSAIDTRVISDIEVYTGGYPVRYGEQTGGLVVVNSLIPDESRMNEIGLSVFSTSVMSAGQINGTDSSWILSARRGNLDLILKPELGEPAYYDVFGKIDAQLSANSRLSLNGLLSTDRVFIVPASDPGERIESANDTRNLQLWANWEQVWSEGLTSQTTLSLSDIDSLRTASLDDVEKIVGQIDDRRDIRVLRLTQDWSKGTGERLALDWGWLFAQHRADIDYSSSVDYPGPLFQFPGSAAPTTRESSLALKSDSLAAYASLRWQWSSEILTDFGLRWDKQTHIGGSRDGQWSPRFSLLYSPGERSQIRLNWGRYYQSQRLNELQVEDGVNEFFKPQRSDHLVAAMTHNPSDRLSFRAEAYQRKDKDVRPRFENFFDPFSTSPELEPDRIGIRPSSARSRGVELSFQYHLSDATTFWGGYAWAQSRETINNREQPRSWDQRHAINAGYSWTGTQWAFNVSAKAHSGWPRTDVSLISTPQGGDQIVIGERNADRFGHFLSLDLRLDYTHSLPKGELNWFFEVSNATNRRNACCVDFDLELDDDGRLILDEQDEYWFPLLPAFGVLWTF